MLLLKSIVSCIRINIKYIVTENIFYSHNTPLKFKLDVVIYNVPGY